MSQSTFSQIEERFSQLAASEQRELLDRLARRFNQQSPVQAQDADKQLPQMAADPEIQREIDSIEREFAFAESDGLEHP